MENLNEETKVNEAAEEMHPADLINEETENSETGDTEQNRDTQTDEIIIKLTRELEAAKDTILRKVAEFENLKRRSQKERVQLFTDAKSQALEKFLPIRDDLQRSLDAAENLKIDTKFLEGINMVAEKFENVLQEYGVEAIDQEMVPFNVDIHDALLSQPASDDSIEPNTVLKVLENGYKIGEKVIKHAKVIVSQ